jgi:hypothetical protein
MATLSPSRGARRADSSRPRAEDSLSRGEKVRTPECSTGIGN